MKRFILLISLFFPVFLSAQHEDSRYVQETDSLVLEKLELWRDLKFGLLMHWGPYSQRGIVESWSICSEDEGWCRRSSDDYGQYKKEYEKLKESFDPVEFDPRKWARAAAGAGMKYVVFTTKHHDGFCMYDTQTTNYKITDPGCPFHISPKADVTKEIFNAFRAEGFWTGAYFSKPDWHCPDYWWPNFATPDRNVNYDPSAYPKRWERFIQFTHEQILELVTDYGPLDILWLDGGWVAKLSESDIQERYRGMLENNSSGFLKRRFVSQDIRMDELVEKVRSRQPGLIVVDRAVPGPYQNYLTPENRVPETMLPYPWESCLIAGGGWSWVPDAQYKSAYEVVRLLADIVCKGGNLLLNIAPGPDGRWDEGAYELLAGVGAWLHVNGEAIYGTRPLFPYKQDGICFTQKASQIYLICPGENKKSTPPREIDLHGFRPPENSKIVMLGAKPEFEWEYRDEGCRILIPESVRQIPPCRTAWVLKIE